MKEASVFIDANKAIKDVSWWCVVLLKQHSSIVRVPGRYVLTSIDAIPSSFPLFQGG